MATNFYFNNIGASQEQNLIEDLIVESIKIYGIDMVYIPRTTVNRDPILREGETYKYETGISVEMYVKNVNGMVGEGEFLSKFGLEVRENIILVMAQRVFADEIGIYNTRTRPNEGDLIWFPLTQALYQIRFVNKKPIFYQMGALQTYEMTCELYEYSSEVFETGIPTIDEKYNALSMVTNNFNILTESGDSLATESGHFLTLESFEVTNIDTAAQNEYFETESLSFVDFTEFDPFSEGTRT